ncbi:peptide ABC transporter substrate-binding protein [Simkania sp.]|uniref:peptide ABC transporter substrate-binding protein n=1 Tax=Simkania sp. TaxID=34094 RepID=UPI003B5227EF
MGIHVQDEKTLVVELEYPTPYLLELMASPQFFPAPSHIAKSDPEWATKPGIVCNGPYTLEKWRMNSELLLSKNTAYWDKSHVYIDNIEIYVMPHSATVLSMYQLGELDWVGSPFMRVSHDISYKLLTELHEDALVYWLAFNTEKPILNHPKFRKALSYAIDRKSITDNVFYQSATPLMAALPSSMSLKEMPYFQDNNQELAKQYLQEALEELELSLEDLPIIYLGYVADLEIHHRTTQAIQDQWRSVLGITNIQLHPVEYNVYFDDVTIGNYDIGFMGWASHVNDPLFILNSFKNKSELINKTNWENNEFQCLLDISEYSASKKARNCLLSEAESILMDEMPIIPICSMKKRFAKNPKLKGVNISNLQSVDFKSAYFED